MIPKIIHYCWFGHGEKPKLAQKCIASWKKYCPDYEIIEWNEDNFDIYKYPYAKWCLDNKKYAFLSDFVRLVVVSKYGGIYFDTDVEVIKSFDDLLNLSAFYGFENNEYIATGLGFGSEANHITITSMVNQYLSLEPNQDGNYEIVSCPYYNTEALVPLGLLVNGEKQDISGATIFPADYFNPYDNPTGKLNKTQNTYSIHWYSKSWISRKIVIRSMLLRPIHRMFGVNCMRKIKSLIEIIFSKKG